MYKIAGTVLLLTIIGCSMKKEQVDLLVKSATVYTVDATFSKKEAFVVKDGKIVDTGSDADMEMKYKPAETLSLQGKYVYPGWNDAHAHFVGYANSLNQVDLVGTRSVAEVIERCKTYAESNPGQWIIGRGWDQNDWEDTSFPDRNDLDAAFPDTPVLLRRIDGHAEWANSRALEIAGITGDSFVEGGEIIMENGTPTGILIDNASGLVTRQIPDPGTEELTALLAKAEKNCFAVGLTSVSDAGLPNDIVHLIDSLQKNNQMKMRINAWLSPSQKNIEEFVEKGIIQNEHLTIGTIKLYADGALGSRGARLLEPYADDPGNRGLFVTSPEDLKEFCRKALENNYQVATHCIGDEANRMMLKMYGSLLDEGNDRRWRIEHAQVIHPDDFSLFGKYNIVPSVQPTHATSDMYWAEDRLGPERVKGAYSYKTLLDQNGWIAIGSDFPVEDINPLYGFYAAVARKDRQGYPKNGFQMEDALSREEALKGMTIWAAKAAFEENWQILSLQTQIS